MKTADKAMDFRCGHCNRLLARGHLEAGHIELACPRCKTRVILRAIYPNTAPHDGHDGESHARTSFPEPR